MLVECLALALMGGKGRFGGAVPAICWRHRQVDGPVPALSLCRSSVTLPAVS